MSLRAKCRSVAGSLLGRRRVEQEMDDEIRAHMAAYAEDLVHSGVPAREAERRARLEFGPAESLKEDCRQALGLRLLDETAQDLRYAVRMLRNSPGFAALAVVTLAVGIGLNTAIFSVVNAWLLKPMPYRSPDRLVAISTNDVRRNALVATTAADLYDWRQPNPMFEDICGWTSPLVTIIRGDEPRQIAGARVNAEFFRMLGVNPQLGRDFLPSDDQPGAQRVAMLSDELWRDAFGGDPGVVGKTIQISGDSVLVIGVMAAHFHVPLMGRTALWLPHRLSDQERADRTSGYLNVIARLKPGVPVSSASQYLKAVAGRLEKTWPATNTGRGVAINSLQDEFVRKAGKEPALLSFGLVGCVLLLACANVANLIVGRALRRQQEMAVRLAIGAGRSRLLRQLLTENLLLFVLAAGLSVVLAAQSMRWIEHSLSYDIRGFLPDAGVFRIDVRTLLYTLGIAIVTGLIFGFAPAVHCWRVDVNDGLRGSSLRASSGVGGARLKSLLVVLEMSLALVVVVASGLMVKGMARMYPDDPGFQPEGLVTARLVLSDSKYTDINRIQSFLDAVLERIRQLPGVMAVGAAQFVPYDSNYRTTPYAIDGSADATRGRLPSIIVAPVTPGYFKALGISLLSGRLLSDQDAAGTEVAAVINQTMALRHWAGRDPIGQHVRIGPKLGRSFTIVGVVRDVQGQTENSTQQPQFYMSARQAPSRGLTLVIRADAGANTPGLYAAIRRAAREVDPGQAIFSITTAEDLRRDLFAPMRVAGQMMTLFGAISLCLAAIGIYGVMSYAVAARRKEFGIRMALGARQSSLLLMVASQGMRLAVIGFAIGIVGALAATRFMTSILYHVSPTDLPTYLLTSLLMLLVAALACYVPARQASAVDPIRTLRHE
jgi:putative ABC transport system permease protein